MKNYIGIDLGGTNVRCALVSENGLVLKVVKEPSEAHLGPQACFEKICRMIEQLDYKSASGIGIGVPGPVDTINQWMVMSSNLPGFEKFPFSAKLTAKYNLPTYMDNDANVAGLAEALVGAGKDLPIVFYVTISTGIGGALVINKKLVSGAHGYAGEIGNIIIDPAREKINHLNAGAVENQASGTGMVYRARKIFDNINHAGDLFDLYKQKNSEAIKLVESCVQDIATAFANIAHVVDPNIFVVGGGVMKSKDILLPLLEKYYNEKVHVGMKNISIVEAKLEEPGIVGAAMLPVSMGK